MILMADNGPMTHNGPPGNGGDAVPRRQGRLHSTGGVRVPAMAWWPGVIEPGQVVGDIVHETDLFTTFARLGRGEGTHPDRPHHRRRRPDGSLLLNGDTHSRRDYVFVYTGNILAASVKGRYKRRWVGDSPGLSGAVFYDLYTDPREVSGKMLPMFPTKSMFNIMKTRHLLWKERYPDKGQNRDFPAEGHRECKAGDDRRVEASHPEGQAPLRSGVSS